MADTTDIEKARQLFQEAGLSFPTIPHELAVRLKDQGKFVFSTRRLHMSPYNLQHYVREADESRVEDYAVLSHSGHGVNSLCNTVLPCVWAPAHVSALGRGGIYMDANAEAAKIQECFSLADEIVPTVVTLGQLGAGKPLTIVGSDFYGSYWAAPGQNRQQKVQGSKGPAKVLTEVFQWMGEKSSTKPADAADGAT